MIKLINDEKGQIKSQQNYGDESKNYDPIQIEWLIHRYNIGIQIINFLVQGDLSQIPLKEQKKLVSKLHEFNLTYGGLPK